MPRHSQIQRLSELARTNGVDVRNTLLRVIVDLFVGDARHSAAEITRFGELVLRLVETADEDDRARVAEKLAIHPDTPAIVARRFALDTGPVAAPILKHSQSLTEADLLLAVLSGDAAKCVAVASRRDLGLAVRRILETNPDPAVEAALAGLTPLVISTEAPQIQTRVAPDHLRMTALGFLDGGPTERRAILAELANAAVEDVDAVLNTRAPDAARQVELAALGRRPGALAAAIAKALTLSMTVATRIADDSSGEALVVCAKALDLGQAATTRLLLFANPEIGTSVERVHGMTAFYDAIPLAAALAIVSGWRLAGPVAAPRHAPVLSADSSDRVGARQAASADPRRAPARPADTSQPVRRKLDPQS